MSNREVTVEQIVSLLNRDRDRYVHGYNSWAESNPDRSERCKAKAQAMDYVLGRITAHIMDIRPITKAGD